MRDEPVIAPKKRLSEAAFLAMPAPLGVWESATPRHIAEAHWTPRATSLTTFTGRSHHPLIRIQNTPLGIEDSRNVLEEQVVSKSAKEQRPQVHSLERRVARRCPAA
ncbi:hypothetical protein ACFWZA_01820 [[Kitasatospora] papulosa]|uniref:hypothetical protein n=1 Tax=Streptomyces TaxID=1883 RepID=UPI003657E40E